MEDVYIDLGLEEGSNHPDNQGWMTIFRLWWNSPTFQSAWEISSGNFGSRFQRWCKRELAKKPAEMDCKRFQGKVPLPPGGELS